MEYVTEKNLRRLCILFSILFILGACAETQLIVHTAKRLSISKGKDPTAQSKGMYKVGNPYQIKGIWYHPKVDYNYNRTGIASWYGPGFHGKKTANGEIYDQNALTAAHKTLPMPSLVQVTNLENGRSLRLTINDRGPYAYGRIIDVSRRGAQLLGFHRRGTARVQVQILGAESRLMAQQAKGEALLSSVGSPIQPDTKLPKADVAKETLAPPKGANVSNAESLSGDKKLVIQKTTSRERLRASTVRPDGKVTSIAVKPSKMYIQVGAFTKYQNAYRSAARLGSLHNIKVTSKIVNGREFFRVRAGPILSLNEADHLLESILRVGFGDARIIVD